MTSGHSRPSDISYSSKLLIAAGLFWVALGLGHWALQNHQQQLVTEEFTALLATAYIEKLRASAEVSGKFDEIVLPKATALRLVAVIDQYNRVLQASEPGLVGKSLEDSALEASPPLTPFTLPNSNQPYRLLLQYQPYKFLSNAIGLLELAATLLFAAVLWAFKRRYASSSKSDPSLSTNQSDSVISALQNRLAQAESAARNYEDLVENLPDLVTRVDTEGRFIYVNNIAERVLGLSAQDCIGLNAFDFIHPMDREKSKLGFSQWLVSGQDHLVFENWQLGRSGNITQMEWTIRPERDEAGQVVGFYSVARDITQLRKQEQFLANSQAIANIGSWMFDRNRNQVIWSDETFRLFGLDPNVDVAPNLDDFFNLIHEHDQDLVRASLTDFFNGNSHARLQYRTRPVDGISRWLQGTSRVEKDDQGNVVHMHGTIQDITDHKLQQEQLAISAASLAAISQGVFIATPDRRIVYVNQACCEITGYAEDEMLGTHARVLSGPATSVETLAALEEAIKNGTEYACEFINYRKNGQLFWNDLTLSPLRDSIGQITHYIGVVRDVTARKQAEDQLRQNQESLVTTLNSIGDAVIATDPQGLITRMNPTAERMTGWVLAEALGQPLDKVFSIINSESRGPVTNPVQMVMALGEVVGLSNHTALIARDGREYQIADSAAPILNHKGKIEGVVLVFSDVTEKYLVEKELKRSLEMLERTGELAQVGGWEMDLRTQTFNFTRAAFHLNDIDDMQSPTLANGLDLYAPEYQTLMKSALNAAIERGEPWDLEVPKTTFKGRQIWVRTQGSAIQEHGKTIKLVGAFQDITERKQAELELRTSEARYFSVISALSEGVVIHQSDGAISAANKAAEDILGMSADQLQGRTPSNHNWGAIHEDGTAFLPEDHPGQRALLTGQPHTNIVMGVNKPDGSRIWVSINAVPIFTAGEPQPTGAVSSFVDITLRKASQAQLQLTAERLELVMRGSNDASWDWDLLTDQMYYSPRWWQMLGYVDQEQDNEPKVWQNLLHPDDAQRVAEKFAHSLSSNSDAYEVEFRLRHKQGHYVPVLSRGFILRDSIGQALRVSGTNMDLTERKRAEDAVLASQRFLATISQGIPGMVAHWDKNLRCDFANREYLNWFGKTLDQVLGKTPSEVIGEALYRENEPHMLAAFRGEAVSVHRLIGRPGEHQKDFWAQYLPDFAGDEVVGMFVLVSDITALKNTERALHTSLKEKDALLKEVHHRVKNNLQVINSLLRLEGARSEQPQTKHVLSDMQDRIRAMALLHESLQRSGTFAAIDLGNYLRQLSSQSFRALASTGSHIELVLKLDSIMLDMDQAMPCGLLVSELMSNALKHGFPNGLGGSVTVELKAVDGNVELTVSDTGVGLPANFAIKRAQSLGLQLVSDLATQLGGTLSVGPDARFNLIFPWRPPVLTAGPNTL